MEKDWLIEHYINKKLSTRQVAKISGNSNSTVRYWLNKYNIKLRNKSEALSGENNPMYGKKHTLDCIKRITENSILLTQEEVAKKIEDNGFVFLSKYGGKDAYGEIKCKNCGLVKELKAIKNAFVRKPKCLNCGIFHDGKWIRYEETLEEVKELCNQHKINFLDDIYNGIHFRHNLSCHIHNSYVWKNTFGELKRAFKRGGSGCKKCAVNNLKLDLLYVKHKLFEQHIDFLDKEYINILHKHTLKCNKCNYIWKPSLYSVLSLGSGCPKCKSKYNEKLTGIYLNEIFPNHEFNPFTLFEQIIINGEKIRNRLFIDYKSEINGKLVFVEYNGTQHYQHDVAFFGQTLEMFKKQQQRDIWLEKYCKDNGIVLIVVDGRIYIGDKIKLFLIEKFGEVGLL